jgi:hypothetical protein
VEVAGDPGSFVSRFREIVAEVDVEATALAQPMADLMETEARVFRLAFLSLPLPVKIAIAAIAVGLIILLASLGWERYRTSKEEKEKFKEVDQ